nr:helix-turn-helix transcriptional regulator [Congregibacter litoralis]
MVISSLSPFEVQLDLACKLKSVRKRLGHSRSEAAHRSGVPAPTLRRFEDTGEISLRQFLMLCAVYGALDVIPQALPGFTATTMDELIEQSGRPR